MKLRWAIGASVLASGAWLLTGHLCLAKAGKPKAPPLPKDNSFCLVCHINFDEEELAADHVAKEVTCMHCHGVSYDHRDDESHRTPPDVLFGRAEVEPFCKKCHKKHKDQKKADAFLAEWDGKLRPNGRVVRENAVCTDCHGVHVVQPVRVAE